MSSVWTGGLESVNGVPVSAKESPPSQWEGPPIARRFRISVSQFPNKRLANETF